MAKAKEAREETQQTETRQGKEQYSQGTQSAGTPGTQQSGVVPRSRYGVSPSGGSPFSFVRRFSEEMDRLFEDFGFGRNPFAPSTSFFGGRLSPRSEFGQAAWSPQIEVFERGNNLVVRADLPGLTKNDIKVDVQEGCLTIQGERRQEHEEEKEGSFRSERSYGRFYRCLELPKGIDTSKVNASFRDGVLEVTMPAPPREETGGRRIEIKE